MTPDTPIGSPSETRPPATAPAAGNAGELTPSDLAEIQGIVVYGTRMPRVRYLFFKVRDGAAIDARRFVRHFSPGGAFAVTTAAASTGDEATGAGAVPVAAKPVHRVYVAFTAAGLRRLGLADEDIRTFPTDFQEGARTRAVEAVGDTGANAPDHWTLSDDDIDIAVLVYGSSQAVIDDWSARIIAAASGCDLAAERSGATLEHLRGETDPLAPRHEHFGFADGISQPRLRGVPPLEGKPADGRPEVAPGLFILGHPDKDGPSLNPVDMARSITFDPVPKPEPLARNGSFAAFRIMAQDCDAFERFLAMNAGAAPGDAPARERLAARVVGRWKDGSPLAVSPDRPAAAQARANDFDYRDDPHGARCPLGAHARRANPRGTVVLGGNGDAVRLIRRGIPYGDPYEKNDGKERGLLGLFFCASLKHQFEFIMKHWVNDGLFARGLPHDHKDPLVGSHELGTAHFSYRTAAGTVEVDGLTRFVTTRGAAYLFFPSTRGLAFLSNPDHAGPELLSARVLSASAMSSLPSREAAPMPSDDQLIAMIAKGTADRVAQTRHRDAHAKHHGIVRATFRVLPDVPARLRHGIFATPAVYPAYVRFSNGRVDPKPGADGQPLPNEVAFPHDALPDARGLAIKVMKVPGDKLLTPEEGGERATQDFILVNHPTFFAGSLLDYVRVLEQAKKSPEVLAPFFHSHASPLTTEYFSQTAYALGPDLVARYRALPVSPAAEAELTPAQYGALAAKRDKANYLQETLAAQLASGPATFDFLVQVPDDRAQVDVDDASQPWTAPYYRVAQVEIPGQWFLSMLQQQFARDISFNPWHALDAHKPLGPINRARRAVYVATAQARRAVLAAPVREPDGSETF